MIVLLVVTVRLPLVPEIKLQLWPIALVELEIQISVPEPPKAIKEPTGALMEVAVVRPAVGSAYNLDGALDPVLLTKELRVRNWRPGDRFWPGHSKSPKKIKRLLQDRHVTGTDRKVVPVIVSGTEIIWVEGFPVPAAWRPGDARGAAVIIQTTKLP